MPAYPDYIAENSDRSLLITLSRAYTLNGKEVGSITLREPTVKDQKLFASSSEGNQKQAMEMEAKLLAHLSGELAPDDFDAFALRDYRRLQEAFSFFID